MVIQAKDAPIPVCHPSGRNPDGGSFQFASNPVRKKGLNGLCRIPNNSSRLPARKRHGAAGIKLFRAPAARTAMDFKEEHSPKKRPQADAPGDDGMVGDFLTHYGRGGRSFGSAACAKDHIDHELFEPVPAGPGMNLHLALGALGVVFGDIGTSPLYAFKACFFGDHAVAPNQTNVFGVLSMIFWSLALVVSLKYVTFIMRADYKGEGGIFALLHLLRQGGGRLPRHTVSSLVFFTLLGAALFFADGMITPAISVLSAVEGLEVATHVAGVLVLPLTIAILGGLFYLQRRGSGVIGRLFGPVMVAWFLVIGLCGLAQVAANPSVLLALSPTYAIGFFVENGLAGLAVLGAVVLCITGCEALYADMGHFGAKPIRISWYVLVLPALVLNYFGKGAGLLANRAIMGNPFYGIVPHGLLLPVVLLATLATICASQAMISGVFSLVRQAVALGYLPRLHILQTSRAVSGQVYIPAINTAMMCASIALVLLFRESVNLAGAYGIAVTGTMAITTGIFFFVLMHNWGWSEGNAAVIVTGFLVLDLLFFGANLMKFFDGGWIILLASAIFMACMMACESFQKALWGGIFSKTIRPQDPFLAHLAAIAPPRVPGTAVFLARSDNGIPVTLMRFFNQHQVLHEQVLVLAVTRSTEPSVPEEQRLTVRPLGRGIHQLSARYGFMETPCLPELLEAAAMRGLPPIHDPVYFLDRKHLAFGGWSLANFLGSLLAPVLFRDAETAWPSFGVPRSRVMEVRGG